MTVISMLKYPLPGGGRYRRFVYNAAEIGGGNVPLMFGREISHGR